ncbi:uncharacterized protein LOC109862340 [Pseudomyrmex gracilis]|uniref:uncharacterized protein LOC109862340 n=1 Tax=Pseudomyrmex gracilis TaxID=219809 RepID=UPI000995BFE7|nr:uncharacterized protein LOC109862340 [Pseudomyrmex gracilis]
MKQFIHRSVRSTVPYAIKLSKPRQIYKSISNVILSTLLSAKCVVMFSSHKYWKINMEFVFTTHVIYAKKVIKKEYCLRNKMYHERNNQQTERKDVVLTVSLR